MKPIFISVDTEYTTGDLYRGQCMQVAFVSDATNRVGQWVLPITTDAVVNQWVRDNLKPLVTSCLHLEILTHHLPPIHTPKGAKVPAALFGIVSQMEEWLKNDIRETFFQRLEKGDDPDSEGRPPLVMVTWCGGRDFGFIDLLFGRCSQENPFHYDMVDISGMAYGLGLPWCASSSDIEKLVEVAPNPNPHDALADAKYQLELFRGLQKLR